MVAAAWNRKAQVLPAEAPGAFPSLSKPAPPLQDGKAKSQGKHKTEQPSSERPMEEAKKRVDNVDVSKRVDDDDAAKSLESDPCPTRRTKMKFKPLHLGQQRGTPISRRRSDECPICTEAYSEVRRAVTHRACCKQELCAQCDHQSVTSGKCYFCRDEQHDFPNVHTVVSVGFTVAARRR